MRSSSIPLTTLDNRTSSSYWMIEHKKDFDPSAKIDQSVFDDAEEDCAAPPPTTSLQPNVESSTFRTPSYDSILRVQSGDYRIPSTDSARAPSDDSYLQSLIAATALYEQASRMASGESTSRIPSVESTESVPTPELSQQRTASGEMFQALLASISREKKNHQQRLSTYDQITQDILNEDRAPAPAAPVNVAPVNVKSSRPALTFNPPTKHAYLPPGGNRQQKRVYVDEIRELDVLCGRGGKSNHHYGNKKYRQVVSEMKEGYRGISAKTAKTDLSRQIVDHVLEYGGRFLKRDTATGRYYVLRHDQARKKTSQALRETKILKWTLDSKGQPITA